MATENREVKTVSPLAYFDHPTYQQTWSTSTMRNTFQPSSILTMMALLTTFIPVAYAQGANGGIYFRDIRGGLYFVTTHITNITSKVVDLINKGACESTLEKIVPKNPVMHLVADFCKRPRIGEGMPDPTTFIHIYSIGDTNVNSNFVECLKNFFTKSCYDYFTDEFNQAMRWALPLSIGIVAIIGIAFYHFIIRPANRLHRPARPVINNSETDIKVSGPTFQSRFKELEDRIQALVNDINSLNDLNVSNEYNEFVAELNKFKESHSCPIHHDIMNIPTTLSSGITYDKASITEHLLNSNICPMSKKLVPRAVPSVDVFRKNTINDGLSALEYKLTILAILTTKLEQSKSTAPTNEIQPANDNTGTELRQRRPN